MKGVILTAGKATRLRPITFTYGKVLVPIYNKPMIFYGVSLFIKSGITDIAIVCNNFDLPFYKQLFKNKFNKFGINIKFFVQKKALGTAHALKYAKKFIGDDSFALLFGDNIFIMNNMDELLENAIKQNTGATLFAKEVSDPQRFGIIEYDNNFNILNIEEKPEHPKTNFSATGLYVFNNEAIKILNNLKPSARGEYEITDIIKQYVSNKNAKVKILNSDCNWLDTGTFDSLLDCSDVVCKYEKEFGLIGCIELEMFCKGYIDKTEFEKLVNNYSNDYKTRIYETIKLRQQKKRN